VIRIIDQYEVLKYVVLTLESDEPYIVNYKVIIDNVEYNVVPSFDIGFDKIVLDDTGKSFIGSEAVFV